jgi:hypothetical protein
MVNKINVTLLSETLGGGGQLLSYCVGYLSRSSVPRAYFYEFARGGESIRSGIRYQLGNFKIRFLTRHWFI